MTPPLKKYKNEATPDTIAMKPGFRETESQEKGQNSKHQILYPNIRYATPITHV